MFDFLTHLFDTTGFSPRWSCDTGWTPGHGWLHILSDLAIWSAYFTIPSILVYFVLCRRDVPFPNIFWLFGAFILACGTTHLMDVILFWHPLYRLAGVIKLLTAIVSWGTVAALIPTIPKALALRSSEELEREIAARQQAEVALQRANAELEQRVLDRTAQLARHQEILQLAHRIGKIGHWEWNSVTDENKWSPEIEALYGLQPGTFGGTYEAWAKLLHPDDLSHQEEVVRRAFDTGEYLTEFRVIWPDGSVHWLEARGTALKDGHDKPVRFVGVNMDVTERKLAEEALRQSTARLRDKEAELDLVLNRTPLLLTRCRRDLSYVYVNRAYAKFLGKSAEQIVGRPLAEIMGEVAFAKIAPHIESVLRGNPVEFEAEIPYAGLGRRVMRALYMPDRNEHGDVIGWIATLSDVTDRKQLDREREDRAAELAVALGKRTEEARRAEDAERLLQEADRRKDEFLATLAHELRNPLAPLRNALELMRLAKDDANLVEESRSIMERQVHQLVRLVDDLLDISRITNGKLQLRKERVELAEVLKSAIETARPLIEGAWHELTITLPPQPVHVNADPTRLAQVFANLLNNAAKYSEKSGHIWLTAQRRGDEAVITVRDTGIGIPGKHLPHVFNKFAQLETALERSQGGLGLGLSLVKGLVEMHGGVVEAHSDGRGKGSEFTVRVPIVEVPVPAPQASSGDRQESGTVRKCRILVVDDVRVSTYSLAKVLQMKGHDVQTAYDGLEAVQSAATFQPDVVLLDIGLPKMNGYDVARRIRNEPWGGRVALVALTGWGQEEDKRKAFDAGFDHHLTKPVDPAELERLLARIMSARSPS